MKQFEKVYTEIDRTSSTYRDRVMVEVTEFRESLDEFIKVSRLPEATAVRLATIIGLNHVKNSIGYEQIRYLCDTKRVRK